MNQYPRALVALRALRRLRRALVAAVLLVAAGPAVADTPVRVPLTLTAAAAPPAAVVVSTNETRCSGTVLAAHKGQSLIITCAHCYGGRDGFNGTYPVTVTVKVIATGKEYSGRAVWGDWRADVAAVLVGAELVPVQGVAPWPATGARVEHWGSSSGHAPGSVLDTPRIVAPLPYQRARSTAASIPGDSGAGMFSAGKLVGQNWGYYLGDSGQKEQAATPIEWIGAALMLSDLLKEWLPVLRELFKPAPVPPGSVLPPVPPVKPAPPLDTPPPPPYYPPVCQRPLLGRFLRICR